MKLIALIVAAASLVGVQDTVHTPGNGVSLPKLVKKVEAVYTQEAKDAHIEGTVILSTVVRPDGSTSDVAVSRSLDTTYGLDGQAVNALRQWKFDPGMKDGKAVAVRVSVEITFTLK
jgi:protein TonB